MQIRLQRRVFSFLDMLLWRGKEEKKLDFFLDVIGHARRFLPTIMLGLFRAIGISSNSLGEVSTADRARDLLVAARRLGGLCNLITDSLKTSL